MAGWLAQDGKLAGVTVYLRFSQELAETWILPLNSERQFANQALMWLKGKLSDQSVRVEIPLPQGGNDLKSLLANTGWEYYYTVQSMEFADRPPHYSNFSLSANSIWEDFREELFDSYYETLVSAFESRPGISIPPYETQRQRCLNFGKKLQLLVKDEKVLAFVRVEVHSDGTGELVSLARRPSEKGRGLGKQIVVKGIETVRSMGASRIVLEVTSANDKALKLYECMGFKRTIAMDTWKIQSDKLSCPRNSSTS